MNVETILRNKGNWVATIRPDATVADAVDILNRERIGAIVVSEDNRGVDGILSERDIVIALAEHGEDLLSRVVGDIMTRTVTTCDPSASVGELMAAAAEAAGVVIALVVGVPKIDQRAGDRPAGARQHQAG